MRSSSALLGRTLGITRVHAENGGFVVRITAAFSAGSAMTCEEELRTDLGEGDGTDPIDGDPVIVGPAGDDPPQRELVLGRDQLVDDPAAVANQTRRFCRHAASHNPVRHCVFPVPDSPRDTTGSARSRYPPSASSRT